MKQDSPEVEEGRGEVEDGERGSEDEVTLAEEEEVVIDSATVEEERRELASASKILLKSFNRSNTPEVSPGAVRGPSHTL